MANKIAADLGTYAGSCLSGWTAVTGLGRGERSNDVLEAVFTFYYSVVLQRIVPRDSSLIKIPVYCPSQFPLLWCSCWLFYLYKVPSPAVPLHLNNLHSNERVSSACYIAFALQPT